MSASSLVSTVINQKAAKEAVSFQVKKALIEDAPPEALDLVYEKPEYFVEAMSSPVVVRKFIRDVTMQERFFAQPLHFRRRAMGLLLQEAVEGDFTHIADIAGNVKIVARMLQLDPKHYTTWHDALDRAEFREALFSGAPSALLHADVGMDALTKSVAAMQELVTFELGRQAFLGDATFVQKATENLAVNRAIVETLLAHMNHDEWVQVRKVPALGKNVDSLLVGVIQADSDFLDVIALVPIALSVVMESPTTMAYIAGYAPARERLSALALAQNTTDSWEAWLANGELVTAKLNKPDEFLPLFAIPQFRTALFSDETAMALVFANAPATEYVLGSPDIYLELGESSLAFDAFAASALVQEKITERTICKLATLRMRDTLSASELEEGTRVSYFLTNISRKNRTCLSEGGLYRLGSFIKSLQLTASIIGKNPDPILESTGFIEAALKNPRTREYLLSDGELFSWAVNSGGAMVKLFGALPAFRNPEDGVVSPGVEFHFAGNGVWFAYTPSGGVYRSDTDGEFWVEMTEVVNPDSLVITGIIGKVSGRLWLCSSSSVTPFSYSDDMGFTWTPHTPVDTWAGGVGFVRNLDGIYVAVGVGQNSSSRNLAFSTDNGVSWTSYIDETGGALPNSFVDLQMGENGRWVASVSNRAYYSDTNGLSWEISPSTSQVTTNLVHLGDGNWIGYAATANISVSSNNGSTWNVVSGIGLSVTGILLGDDKVYFWNNGTGATKLVVSEDAGETWSPVSLPGIDRIYSTARLADGTLFLASYTMLYRSTDNGETWDDIGLSDEWLFGGNAHVYALDSRLFRLGTNRPGAISHDMGATWAIRRTTTETVLPLLASEWQCHALIASRRARRAMFDSPVMEEVLRNSDEFMTAAVGNTTSISASINGRSNVDLVPVTRRMFVTAMNYDRTTSSTSTSKYLGRFFHGRNGLTESWTEGSLTVTSRYFNAEMFGVDNPALCNAIWSEDNSLYEGRFMYGVRVRQGSTATTARSTSVTFIDMS